MRTHMNHLVNNFWNIPFFAENFSEKILSPSCEIEEAKDHFIITLEIPGIRKEDLNIEVGDQQLTISGERQVARQDGSENKIFHSERSFGKFKRSFQLPEGTRADKIEAHCQDGILTLAVPKVEAVQPRRIEITAGGRSGSFSNELKGESKNEQKAAS